MAAQVLWRDAPIVNADPAIVNSYTYIYIIFFLNDILIFPLYESQYNTFTPINYFIEVGYREGPFNQYIIVTCKSLPCYRNAGCEGYRVTPLLYCSWLSRSGRRDAMTCVE